MSYFLAFAALISSVRMVKTRITNKNHVLKKSAKKNAECSAPAKTPRRPEAEPNRSYLIKPMVFNQRKRSKNMFLVDASVSSQIQVAASFLKGLRIAQHVLESNFYTQMLHTAGIIEEKQVKDVHNKLHGLQFTAKLIQCGKDLNSFVFVHHEDSANTVYFNPILLMKLALREYEKTSKHKQSFINFAARFIMSETLHGVTHLINGEFNQFFTTHPLALVGPSKTIKLKEDAPELTFSDYGNIAEVGVTGFIAECRSNNSGDSFGLDGIVLYCSEKDQDENNGFLAAADDTDLELQDIDKDPGLFRYVAVKSYDGKSLKHTTNVSVPDYQDEENYCDNLGPSRR